MNRQEIFDKVATHLMTQDRKCTVGSDQNDGVACLYINDDGDKCAIGILIPDGHMGQTCRKSVGGLLHDYPDLIDLWEIDKRDNYKHADISFLQSLQCVHDCSDVEFWLKELTEFARAEGLDYSLLENYS